MTALKTLDDLNTVIHEFSVELDKIKNSPQDVEKAFDKAAAVLATSQGATVGSVVPFFGTAVGAVVGYAYGELTQDDFLGQMQPNKDKIKRKIQELLDELSEAISSMQAPVAFLNTSTDWLSLQTPINQARNYPLNDADLFGSWDGAAADEYRSTRDLQLIAFDTISDNCSIVSECLATLSDRAWEFYSKIVEDLVGYATDFTAAIGKIATGVGAPWGISDLIDALAAVVTAVVSHTKSFIGAVIAQQVNIDKMSSAVDNPKAFKNNTWPKATTERIGVDNPDRERWAPK